MMILVQTCLTCASFIALISAKFSPIFFMRNTRIIVSALAIACVAVVTTAVTLDAQAAEKPKYSMEDIMKKGLKGDDSLLKKVTEDRATDEEKKLLVGYFQALTHHEPSKGDAASWKAKTGALLAATQKVVKGDKAALAQLKEASNCKACHNVHKGDKK